MTVEGRTLPSLSRCTLVELCVWLEGMQAKLLLEGDTLFETALPAAREKGLNAKHFSFNTPGERCERCEGLGQVMVDMHFLSHLQVVCPDCRGKRFNQEVLAVAYREHRISDILELSIEESLPLFAGQK